MLKNIDKYKELFISEAKELIDSMNTNLLMLEKEPTNLNFINNIFRGIHTLKSIAATMDYNNTVQLCHALEDVLDTIKKKKVRLDKSVDILFKCFDTLELTLKRLKEDKTELDHSTLIKKLGALISDKEVKMEIEEDIEILNRENDLPSSVVEKITSVDVKVERLDLLMNLSEELLINRMRLDNIKEELQNPELTAVTDTLSRLIADMQYNVMQARMVPIGFVFNRFPRMVRDLARRQGKQVSIEMKGTDIELDRSIIDEIGESLVHLLRNSIDHGIEKPEDRRKAGKPAQGIVLLTASRIKNSAIIELSDDGAGLDFNEIKKSAISKGILSTNSSEEEIINSIFFGLSTTKNVTAVSGRGFGLNIVKNKIESIGGTIKVKSALKKGASFIIEVPLTLAIIRVLFVEVGGKPYAIPMVNVERLITLNKERIKGMLQFEAIVLENEDIPITRLSTLFGKPSPALKKQPIVIIRRGTEKLGLAVDAFLTTQEIVIKPMNKLIRKSKYFAGTTIIGSGEVVLILDVGSFILSRRTLATENAEKNI